MKAKVQFLQVEGREIGTRKYKFKIIIAHLAD